jgi:hypothetical protein
MPLPWLSGFGLISILEEAEILRQPKMDQARSRTNPMEIDPGPCLDSAIIGEVGQASSPSLKSDKSRRPNPVLVNSVGRRKTDVFFIRCQPQKFGSIPLAILICKRPGKKNGSLYATGVIKGNNLGRLIIRIVVIWST